MATPPVPPPPSNPNGQDGSFAAHHPNHPNDPRNARYNAPYPPDPRVLREQEKAWAGAQREQARAQQQQAKAWRQYQREAGRQQVRAVRQQARMASEAQRAQLRAWRRASTAQSIVGPLLLIAVAVAFLLVYSGRVPGLTMLGWFGRWWPLILIAVGFLRLAEWGLARYQSTDRAVPVRFSIGGGTVLLLILVSVLGLAAQNGIRHEGDTWNFGWTGNDINQFFGSKHEEDSPATTHNIAAEGTLSIENTRGDVTVNGTSDDGMVHVSQHKEVFARDDSRAQTLLDELNPHFSGTDENLSLRVSGADSSTDALTVTVPRGVHLVLNANRGDVAVHDFHAPVVINANRGDVETSAIAGNVQVHTNSRHGGVQVRSVQGAVEVAGTGDEVNLSEIQGPVRVNGDFFGGGRLQHIAGAVNYDAGRIGFAAQRIDGEVSFDSSEDFSADGVSGPVAVRTRSRNVTLARVNGNVQVTNSSGHVDVTAVPPTGTIAIDNRDGDVNLSLPASAKFTVSAETNDGSVHSDFPGAAVSTTQSTRGSMSASVGGGGPEIRLTTTHGNIALQKSDTTAMPSMPPMPPMPPAPALSFKMPPDAQDALKSAQREVARARREADRARAEGEKAGEAGRAEAEKARQKAMEAGEKAREAAEKARQQALKQAEDARNAAGVDKQ